MSTISLFRLDEWVKAFKDNNGTLMWNVYPQQGVMTRVKEYMS